MKQFVSLWGTFPLGPAAASASTAVAFSLPKLAGAHQGAGEGRLHPRHAFDCDNSSVAPGGFVDQILSGHITISRPIVCETTQVRYWSLNVNSADLSSAGCRYSACEIACHRWEQPVVAVCGAVPVADIVTLFTAGTHRHHRATATAVQSEKLMTKNMDYVRAARVTREADRAALR